MDETQRAIELLADLRRKADRKTVEELITTAKRFKPPPRNGRTFDGACQILKDAYGGAQTDRLRRLLKARYHEGKDMWALPLNIVREWAELRAQVYREAPRRALVVDGVDPYLARRASPSTRARAGAFADLVELARLDSVFLEAERISGVAGSAFLKTRWAMEAGRHGRQERPEITLYWPHQVDVIPSPSAPGELWAAHAVILHLAHPDPDTSLYEVWTRDEIVETVVEGEDLAEQLRAGWWHGRVTSKGDVVAPMRPYEIDDELPINRLCHRPPGPAIFPEPEHDLITLQDEINVAHSDNRFKMALQSHLQIAVAGGDFEGGKPISFGVSEIMDLPRDAQVTTIPSDYDSTQLDSIEQMMRMQARAERLPEDAFFSKGGNPETGVARELRNRFSDQRRFEHVEALSDFEAEQLRTLARVADVWGPWPVQIDGDDVEYQTTFKRPQRLEDERGRQERLERQYQLGLISQARLAVELGAYDDEVQAAAAGLSLEVKQPPTPEASPGAEEIGADDAET